VPLYRPKQTFLFPYPEAIKTKSLIVVEEKYVIVLEETGNREGKNSKIYYGFSRGNFLS
jgi:hypothetical protein